MIRFAARLAALLVDEVVDRRVPQGLHCSPAWKYTSDGGGKCARIHTMNQYKIPFGPLAHHFGPLAGRLTVAAFLTSTLLLTACGGGAPEPAVDETPAEAAPAHQAMTYAVRGEVTQMPAPDNPGYQFMVRHEPVHQMVDQDGEPMAMHTMNMPFFPNDEAILEGLAVGDKIEMTLVMDWEQVPAMRIDAISKLPADTELVFSEDGNMEGMEHEGMEHEGMEHGNSDSGHDDHGAMDHSNEGGDGGH